MAQVYKQRAYVSTEITSHSFVHTLPYNLPPIVDETHLAHVLGVTAKQLWWAVTQKKTMYSRVAMDRGPGKPKRVLNVPEGMIKTLQCLTLGCILNKITMPDYVGAYTPGRGITHTASKHVNKKVVVTFDLKDFYDHVFHRDIMRVFEGFGYMPNVAHILADIVTFNNRAPQGAPTSGYVANIVSVAKFDNLVLEYLRQHKYAWVYTRYSDDIAISTSENVSLADVKDMFAQVSAIIKGTGFKIHPRKTKFQWHNSRQIVLGITVNNGMHVRREDIKDTCKFIDLIRNDGIAAGKSFYAAKVGREVSAADVAMFLEGKISFYKQVNKDQAAKVALRYKDVKEALPILVSRTVKTDAKGNSYDTTERSESFL